MTHLEKNSFAGYVVQYEPKWMFLLSLFVHLVFLSVLLYIPDFRRIEISGSQVISVDIVSLPRQGPVSGSSGTPVQQIKPSKPSSKKEVKTEESHPSKKMTFKKEEKKEKKKEKKKAEEKQKIKKKTTDTSDHDEKSDEAIEKAIEKIRLGLITKKGEGKEVAGSGAGGSGIGYSMPGQGGSGKTADLKFQIYYSIIWSKIKDAWVLPENMTSADKKLEAIIAIRIKKDGEIVKVWTEKSSGNNYFDQSALRAIAKANPLPPVPEGYGEEYFELGIRFLPSEQ